MSTSCKTKANQQPVLAANVAQILEELHRLATANARPCPAAEKQGRGIDDLAMVIRGK